MTGSNQRNRETRHGDGAHEAVSLMHGVARGDETAFEQLYDMVIRPLYGLICRVVRDPTQSEEVAQEVMVELWRTASRYSPDRGTPMSWAMTLAHRRAVDRVRSEQTMKARETRVGRRDADRPFDEVAERVTIRLEHEQVRNCLSSLTEVQRETVLLAYYHGRSYREVGDILGVPVNTIKTRMRDAMIRLRDCLGVV